MGEQRMTGTRDGTRRNRIPAFLTMLVLTSLLSACTDSRGGSSSVEAPFAAPSPSPTTHLPLDPTGPREISGIALFSSRPGPSAARSVAPTSTTAGIRLLGRVLPRGNPRRNRRHKPTPWLPRATPAPTAWVAVPEAGPSWLGQPLHNQSARHQWLDPRASPPAGGRPTQM